MAKQTEQFERKAIKSEGCIICFVLIFPKRLALLACFLTRFAYELGIHNSENGTTGLKGFYAINLL